MKNDFYDLETMLYEAKQKLDRQFKSVAVLREHSKTIFASSSVIVSLFVALKTTSVPKEKIDIYVAFWIAMAVLYILLTIVEIKTIFPREILGAIKPTWEEYRKAFRKKSKEDILLMQISAYLNVIEKNQSVVNEQEKWSIFISYLFPILVICIIILGFVQVF